MIDEKDSKYIRAVVGDELAIDFKLQVDEPEKVTKMTFICKDLNLEIALVARGQDWILRGGALGLRPGSFYYDIVEQRDSKVTTVIYHGLFEVMPQNPPKTTFNNYYDYPHNIKKEH